MDKNLYEIMQEIYQEKRTEFSKDIKLIGTLTSEENTPDGPVPVTNDVFVIIDEMPDGTISQRFVITSRDKDGKIYPAQEFAQDDLSFLGQFQNMDKVEVVSLKEWDKQLEHIARELGINKEDILSIEEIDLDQLIEEKDKEGDKEGNKEGETPKISLDDKGNDNEQKKQNENALEGITQKQEINLDERVDDRYTLAKVLGLPSGCKLFAVYSDNIKGNKNTTKFSCVIKTADGKLMPADMLTQVGGRYSDKTVYNTNWDGSKVQKESVISSYTIDSPIMKNGIITMKYDSAGRVIVSYGKTDPTSHRDAITQQLRGREVFHRTEREVLDEFDRDKSQYDIKNKVDEAKRHPEEEFENDLIDIKDINGRVDDTDHPHGEQIVELIISDADVGETIRDSYTNDEIMEYLKKTARENTGRDFKSIIEMTKYSLVADSELKREAESDINEKEDDDYLHSHGPNG